MKRTILSCRENDKMRVPGGAENVKKAWYGDPEHPWQAGRGIDCTETVVHQLRSNSKSVTACNSNLGGDPSPGYRKELLIEINECSDVQEVEAIAFPQTFKTPEEVPSAPRWVAFVRHAQAGHNVDKALLSVPDNPLTEHGETQAAAAQDGPAGLAIRASSVVICSPLMRALQTTRLLLGEDLIGKRVLVSTMGTERYSGRCDEGTVKSELLTKLPKECCAWEGWDDIAEIWWPRQGEDSWARAEQFIEMLRGRPEDRIVCVGHGGFWQMVMGEYLENTGVLYCERHLH